ncbi:hypothetical protein KRM28CT15_44430 [Krasilnikovia sp. M28-CT-15]
MLCPCTPSYTSTGPAATIPAPTKAISTLAILRDLIVLPLPCAVPTTVVCT